MPGGGGLPGGDAGQIQDELGGQVGGEQPQRQPGPLDVGGAVAGRDAVGPAPRQSQDQRYGAPGHGEGDVDRLVQSLGGIAPADHGEDHRQGEQFLGRADRASGHAPGHDIGDQRGVDGDVGESHDASWACGRSC